jgi:SAM-dependent methyltransferase
LTQRQGHRLLLAAFFPDFTVRELGLVNLIAPAQVARRVLDLAAATRPPNVIECYLEAPLTSAFAFLSPSMVDGSRVLDLGCGAGHFTRAMTVAGASAIGVDANYEIVQLARTFASPGLVQFNVGSVESLPYRDASFDAALSISVLQYVDWRTAIRDCRRVLTAGGRACFVEHLAGHPLAQAYRKLRRSLVPYDPGLTPRRHITAEELTEFRTVFREVQIAFYHVSTPLLLVSDALRGARPERFSRRFSGSAQRIFDALSRLDRKLVDASSGASHFAWLVEIQCVK